MSIELESGRRVSRDGVDRDVSVGVAKACHAFLVRVGLGEFT